MASCLSLRSCSSTQACSRLALCRTFHSSTPLQGNKKTIVQLAKEVDLKGRKVFVRADLNVSIKGGKVRDATRITLSAPTIRFLLNLGAKVVVSSHLGRPKGKVQEEKRLTPLVPILEKAIKAPVKLAPDSIGPAAEAFVNNAKAGEVVLLENTRFHKGESANDSDHAKKLAAFADIYVNDAFAAAHRAHASTQGITQFVKHKVAGILMERELTSLSKIIDNPDHPVVACVGGAKISTKLPVIESLLGKVDTILIGGGMMFTFNKAMGYNIGKSLVEMDMVLAAKDFLAKAEKAGVKVVLPRDFVVAPDLTDESQRKAIHADVKTYEGSGYGVDIGPLTVGDFHMELEKAKTFLWNGPMGILETPRYSLGTDAVTRMAAFLSQKGAMVVVGGGESLISVQKLGLFDKISHVSTGGGAMLEYIEGKPLPGVQCLEDA